VKPLLPQTTKRKTPPCANFKTPSYIAVHLLEGNCLPAAPPCPYPCSDTMSDSIQSAPPSSADELVHKQEIAPNTTEKVEKLDEGKDANKSTNVPAIDVKALTDRTLHFLATASNETLGACLVGLSAGTYLVLGRVGLMLIGVMGGVVLHASWEGQARGDGEDKALGQGDRKRERGVDVVQRVLDWRDTRVQSEEIDKDNDDLHLKLYSGKDLDYSEFRPKTAAALTELTDAVIRDYVRYG
jgi:hypothetical protein